MSMSREARSDVRIFATSRFHLEDISKVLCDFPKLLIEARDSDMRRLVWSMEVFNARTLNWSSSFLLQRIEDSEDLEDIVQDDEDFQATIIETLVEKANKM